MAKAVIMSLSTKHVCLSFSRFFYPVLSAIVVRLRGLAEPIVTGGLCSHGTHIYFDGHNETNSYNRYITIQGILIRVSYCINHKLKARLNNANTLMKEFSRHINVATLLPINYYVAPNSQCSCFVIEAMLIFVITPQIIKIFLLL